MLLALLSTLKTGRVDETRNERNGFNIILIEEIHIVDKGGSRHLMQRTELCWKVVTIVEINW